MRGGAQSTCSNATTAVLVVKFRNNPQHRRVLVNEWVARSSCATGHRRSRGFRKPEPDFCRIPTLA